MDDLDALRHLLAESTDPDNPPAEEIRRLFETMKRIAVVGLSRDPANSARRVPAYLAAKGYEVVGVNPSLERAFGKPAVASLDEVEPPVDMVIIFRPSAEAGSFVKQALGRPDAPAIWLQQGIRADAEVAQAREEGRLAVQDLCAFKVHRALYTDGGRKARRRERDAAPPTP
ncbi:MAG: CoA-binding protein [Gemmatimonadota bacterium]